MSGIEFIPSDVLVRELDNRMGGLITAHCDGLVLEQEVLDRYPACDAEAISLVLAFAREVRAGRATWEQLLAACAARLADVDTLAP